MPAIITHDTFGREIFDGLEEVIGQSVDEKKAFLLGCQGPDVLFYGIINPFIKEANKFGSLLHRGYCSEFVSALALSTLSDEAFIQDDNFNIAKSYIMGYLMHHELDSKMHPFVYYQQYALCNAGIEGLTENSGSEVHVEIERELDELVLSIKREETIASFDPSERILCASNQVLDIISKMFEFAISIVYGTETPLNMYRSSVRASRHVQRLIYSTGGVKRNIFGSVETLFRDHSYVRAITHKNRFLAESIFDNHEKYEWKHPFIEGRTSVNSFWEIYDNALDEGKRHINDLSEAFRKNLSLSMTREDKEKLCFAIDEIMEGLNFYGCPMRIADPKTGKPKNFRWSK